LKRSTLSIHNRLNSITSDAAFVERVAEAFNLPLLANERCGSWYIPPARKAGSCYFKSTDGHTGEWAFSLRRLNTQVFDVLERWDGCVVVDSTRRGKGTYVLFFAFHFLSCLLETWRNGVLMKWY
jgi:tRNA A64-2'-O-ribosylphosphate transferase